MDQITATFAKLGATLTYDDLPEAALAAARRTLVDSVGVALAARSSDAPLVSRSAAPALSGPTATGRIIGCDRPTTSAAAAAFANTVMIRYLDLNDHLPSSHPSDCLGVFLGAAESLGLSGRQLLTGMSVTYEVLNALQLSSGSRKKGVDQPWAMGIAISAGLGNVLGLSETEIGHAVGIMAASGVALRVIRTGEISKWKAAATAMAGRNALFVTQLVAAGMTGPERAFDGRMGVFSILGPFELPPIGPDQHLLSIAETDLKCWPVCYRLQASVWGALELREQVALHEVAALEIWTHANAADEAEPAKYDPQSRETADHSMPYVVARAYERGEVGPQDFTEAAFLDPAIREPMSRIKIYPDAEIEAAFPEDLIVRMRATTTAGAVHDVEIRNPKGHWKNPLDESDVTAKASRLVAPVLGEARTKEALDWWWNIDDAESLTPGLDLLTVAEG